MIKQTDPNNVAVPAIRAVIKIVTIKQMKLT